jgi:hypothetical protein
VGCSREADTSDENGKGDRETYDQYHKTVGCKVWVRWDGSEYTGEGRKKEGSSLDRQEAKTGWSPDARLVPISMRAKSIA